MLKLIHKTKLWLNEWILWPLISGLLIGMFLNGSKNIEQDYLLERLNQNNDLHLATSSVAGKKINAKLDILLHRQNTEINVYKELITLQQQYIKLLEREN